MNLTIIVLILIAIFTVSSCFENDTVITIEPRFFFKELLSIWSLYLFKAPPATLDTHNNTSDIINTNIDRNVTILESHEEISRSYQCILNPINYWNYKEGRVKIPIVLHIDHPVDKDNAKTPAKVSTNNNNNTTINNNNNKDEEVVGDKSRRCTFILVFAKWCKFSMATVPLFNSLGRIYPQLEFIALPINDYQEFKWNLHTSYVPRIKLYFGNKSVREYNGTDNDLDELIDFVHSVTGQLPYLKPEILDRDYREPISSIIEQSTSFWLIISWILTILSISYLIFATGYGRQKLQRLYQFLIETELFQH